MLARRAVRRSPSRPQVTFAQVLAGSDAWYADNATQSGGFTTSWVPTSGAVTLTSSGTQQAAPAASANLNGRLTVACTGGGSYQGSITPPGLSHTLLFAGWYAGSGTQGFLATTSAGTLNSGTSLLAVNSARYARRLNGNDAILASAPTPGAAIMAGVFTGAASTLYYNSLTPTVAAAAVSGFSFGSFVLGAISGVSQFPMTGEIGFAAVIPRALSAAEIAVTFAQLGSYYGVTISP